MRTRPTKPLLSHNMQPDMLMEYRPLTDAERRVICDKATEPPFSGALLNERRTGTYLCRRCGAPLYRSDDKFDAGCGWPSFDDEIPGAVRRQSDADGRRTEILCARCGGHLGHVFTGEGFTPKQTRHCVNSLSMEFLPAGADRAAHGKCYETAYFAGGCFWGVEYHFRHREGVVSATSGYMGGRTDAPSYPEVCSGSTGHAETVRVVFDPAIVSFEELARLFFEIHDPTQVNRQGPDIGEQYRSEIFYTSEDQRLTADALTDRLTARGYDVATRLTPAGVFWPAEAYHQNHYDLRGTVPYCHLRVKRF